jgi:hypothetical protein
MPAIKLERLDLIVVGSARVADELIEPADD